MSHISKVSVQIKNAQKEILGEALKHIQGVSVSVLGSAFQLVNSKSSYSVRMPVRVRAGQAGIDLEGDITMLGVRDLEAKVSQAYKLEAARVALLREGFHTTVKRAGTRLVLVGQKS